MADQDHHFAVMSAEGFGHVGSDQLDIGVAFGGFLGKWRLGGWDLGV